MNAHFEDRAFSLFNASRNASTKDAGVDDLETTALYERI